MHQSVDRCIDAPLNKMLGTVMPVSDFLGLTSHDLEVANIINHMVPDGQGAYSVVAVLKAVRDKRKKAAAKSKNLEESKQKSEGRRRLQTGL